MSKQKTVRVKIAVAVVSDGYWMASGSPDDSPEGFATELQDRLDGSSIVYVTADIPVPEEKEDPTVDGEVSQ
jgi:hypothetical protein